MKNVLPILLLILISSLVKGQDIVFFQGSFEDFKTEVQEQEKPYIIYHYKKNCKNCDQMERRTFQNSSLIAFINEHFLIYRTDIEQSNLKEEIQYNHTTRSVDELPAIEIYKINDTHPHTMLSGYYGAEELLENLNRVVDAKPRITMHSVQRLEFRGEPKDRDGARPSRRKAPKVEKITTITLNPIHEEPSHPRIAAVDGLENYKPPYFELPAYGLQVGVYSTEQELKDELGYFKRHWKNDIWVYKKKNATATTYILALGTYNSPEAAKSFKESLKRNMNKDSEIVDLRDISQKAKEDASTPTYRR